MNPKLPVTVIIPCYNAGRYLMGCVESINANESPDEILIVDDASEDDSVAHAESVSKRFPNVRILRRAANGGIAKARLDGIRASRNEWIALVDADDYLEPDAVAEAYFGATTKALDVCLWELWRSGGGREWLHLPMNEVEFPIGGREAAMRTLGKWRIHPLGVSKKSLYLQAYEGFTEQAANADELITRLVLANAGAIGACKKRYFYRLNPASSTQTLHPRRLGTLDSQLWLIAFAGQLHGGPSVERAIVLESVNYAWYFFRERRALGASETFSKLDAFFRHLYVERKLGWWVFRFPKSALKVMLLGTWLVYGHVTNSLLGRWKR